MIDYPSKPPQDFFQAPAVSSKAMESVFLNLLRVLVDEKVLSEEKANRVFDDLGPLIRGVNSAHEVSLTVNFWRRTFAWLLKQDRAPSSKRAA
jgi:hypothetical protein